MSVETDLRTYVLADNAVASIVGQRMRINRLQQEEQLPALVYQRIDTQRQSTLTGGDKTPKARFQITSWATTPAAAIDLAGKVRERLDGQAGVWSTTTIQSCVCVGTKDVEDTTTTALLSGRIDDYLVQYEES